MVRLSTNQYTTSAPSAMKMPASRGCSVPQMAGIRAEFAISFDCGTEACDPCSGPPSSNRYWPPKMAIQFSMMVEITSCAPTAALSAPAMAPHTAPPAIDAMQARPTCSGLDMAG